MRELTITENLVAIMTRLATIDSPRRPGRRISSDAELGTTMALRSTHLQPLGRLLWRRAGERSEGEGNRCRDCGRIPLTGEQVHLYEGRRRGVVCDLCRLLRREAPAASRIVHHCENDLAVRVTARAA
jgi:hypothetical protein